MTRAIALLAVLVARLVGACGSSAAATGTPASGGALTVTGAWARPAAAGGESAAYFTIANPTATADALLSVSTDVAESASVHQTSMDSGGMMGMQPVASLAVPAGGSVAFAPGGYHVMLTNLKSALKAGDQVHLTLTFQNAGAVTVTADVRAN